METLDIYLIVSIVLAVYGPFITGWLVLAIRARITRKFRVWRFKRAIRPINRRKNR